MATVNPTQVDQDKHVVISWTGAGSDVGAAVQVPQFGELTIQAVGNGTSVTLQGSNDGGTTWGALGAGVTATVAGNAITRVAEHPALIRPSFTGGTATTLYLSAAKQSY